MADRPETRRLQDLAGDATRLHQCADVFHPFTGKRVIQTAQPLLVTPPGIAMHGQ